MLKNIVFNSYIGFLIAYKVKATKMSAKSDSVSCECTEVKETEVSAKSESMPCVCTEDSTTEESLVSLHCECPRDEHDIVIHEETCLLYRSEKITFFRVSFIFTYLLPTHLIGTSSSSAVKHPLLNQG